MICRLVVAGLLLAAVLSGQDKGKAKRDTYDFHPLMQQVWEAWSTLNPDNAARFYSKDAERTFFDLAPMKYTGWTEYAAGVKKVFADYSSAKFTLTGTSHVAQRPAIAWATATGHGALTKKTGAKDELDFRWTVLWEKSGDDWLIVHEHVSVPMAAPRPAVVPPVTAPKAATAPKK
jgi:ketosteroid isomerase-like protein